MGLFSDAIILMQRVTNTLKAKIKDFIISSLYVVLALMVTVKELLRWTENVT